MTQTELAPRLGTRHRHRPVRSPLYSSMIGLTSLAILLQGVWAGLFIHEGHDFQQGWVEMHARTGDAAIAFALLASIVAVVKLRSRPGIVIGSIALTVLLGAEAYLGGLIGDTPVMSVVHIPLALAVMGLAIWLTVRATRPVKIVAADSTDVPDGGNG